MLKLNEIHHGDCLELMRDIPDGSVDMILCDLPYGTTQNAWDSIIPLDELWPAYKRVLKPGGVVVLTATQPFSSLLVMSNIKWFKYEWIWKKSKVTGVLNAKIQPLRNHEVALVFANGASAYHPQGLRDCNMQANTGHSKKGSSSNYGAIATTETGTYTQTKTGYPTSVLSIPSAGDVEHPTQKPVFLFEYLIRTYTHPGEVVLDNCMGSGTTALAALNTGRQFIGIEQEEKYVQIGRKRIHDRQPFFLFA